MCNISLCLWIRSFGFPGKARGSVCASEGTSSAQLHLGGPYAYPLHLCAGGTQRCRHGLSRDRPSHGRTAGWSGDCWPRLLLYVLKLITIINQKHLIIIKNINWPFPGKLHNRWIFQHSLRSFFWFFKKILNCFHGLNTTSATSVPGLQSGCPPSKDCPWAHRCSGWLHGL